MLRRIIFVVSLFVLLSSITITHADSTYEWTAWLHYGRHMTLVNSAGESLREVDLPLPENNPNDYVISLYIAISHSGDLIAYVAQAQMTYSNHVMVYNSKNQTLILDYALPELSFVVPFNFTNNDTVFNSDDTAIALGYSFAAPSGQPTPRYIGIINLATGEMVKRLDESDLASVYPDFPTANQLRLQFIQHYDANEVMFTLIVAADTNSGSKRVGFAWNTTTNLIREDKTYTLLNDTFEPTGEIIARVETDDFSPSGLQVYDPILHASYPFYLSKDIREARFIQNGEHILIRGNKAGQYWTLIERDGSVVDQWDSPDKISTDSLQGTPDGFLYTASLRLSPSPNGVSLPALIAVNTRDDTLDAGQTIWHLSFQEYAKRAGGSNIPLEIVWEHDDMPPSAYKPWAQLAPPVYEPTPTAPENLPPPTMIPLPEPLFQVGMTVRVQTIGGEILNLRRDHTRKSDVIMYLENKMRLTLLEGPIESEGFTWWRVRTADGVEGWTVENNGDVQTLMPA